MRPILLPLFSTNQMLPSAPRATSCTKASAVGIKKDDTAPVVVTRRTLSLAATHRLRSAPVVRLYESVLVGNWVNSPATKRPTASSDVTNQRFPSGPLAIPQGSAT